MLLVIIDMREKKNCKPRALHVEIEFVHFLYVFVGNVFFAGENPYLIIIYHSIPKSHARAVCKLSCLLPPDHCLM